MRKRVTWLFFALVVVAILVVFFAPHTGDAVRINNESVAPYNHNWDLYIDGQLAQKSISLPYTQSLKPQQRVLIKNTLPEQFTSGMTLCFRSSQQRVQVFIENELVYSYGYGKHLSFGKSPGSAHHFIRMPSDAQQKEISIELVSPYTSYSGKINPINYGSKNANVFHLLNKFIFSLVLSFLIGMIGLILLIVYFFARKNPISISLFYLGIFSLCIAVWSAGESQILQFYIDNMVALTASTFLALMLMPIPLVLFLKEIYTFLHKKVLNFFCCLFMGIDFLLIILQLFTIQDFIETIQYLHISMISFAIYLVVFSISTLRKSKNSEVLSFLGLLLVLISFMSIDLFRFYVGRNIDSALFSRVGVFLFILLLALQASKHVFSTITENLKISFLENLAYVDILTGLKNRTAFEVTMDAYRGQEKFPRLPIILVFDINNLKHLNDTKGHKSGDQLICISATCIHSAFKALGDVFRIGGDEFVVISQGQISQITTALSQFVNNVERAKLGVDFDISIAYGYALYNEALDENIDRLFVRADQSMYDCKVRMKGLMQFGRRRNDGFEGSLAKEAAANPPEFK